MKHPRDSGASPAARFNLIEKKNVIRLMSSDIIRILADYDKSKPIDNRKIWIRELGEFFWFKINDAEWAHKLNNTRVRVRMISRWPNVIYLFDLKTDTYLTFVVREFETAGDAANQTGEDWAAIKEHVATTEELARYRQEKLDTVMAEIELEEKNDAPLPEGLKEMPEIVITDPQLNWKETEEDDDNEKEQTVKATRRRKSKVESFSEAEVITETTCQLTSSTLPEAMEPHDNENDLDVDAETTNEAIEVIQQSENAALELEVI